MKNKIKKLFIATIALSTLSLVAKEEKSIKETAEYKMTQLERYIRVAQDKGFNTLKERTALATAKIFMGYADWDENNIEENVKNFSKVHRYKSNAQSMAEKLPDFERSEIIEMMDDAMKDLKSIVGKREKRLDSPDVDWSKTEIVADAIMYEGKPVFLADWTWKPGGELYDEYFGQEDGFFITGSYVSNENGDLNPSIKNKLEDKKTGRMGFIFMNHKGVPRWLKDKYPEITDGPGLEYTAYDINHPATRKLLSDLIKGVVPYTAGKNYSKLGYMLCNEPHWNTIEKEWTANAISDVAYEDFKKWLKNKHKNIATLNQLWDTQFRSFETIDSPKVMQKSLQGTAMYYDFLSYNMDRVTDWFKFLKTEIRKHDPEAKTHIKIMPSYFTGTKRDSGIDMEALTFDSDIIGNDTGAHQRIMWANSPAEWEKYYSFEWKELAMLPDFQKSVSPEKIMYNTEAHFLSTGGFRDLYLPKEYARLTYWQAYIHGHTALQTWYWARKADGSSGDPAGGGYAGSNNHQPRIVNEVHATVADLNSVSETIMAFQRQKKPIRLFYTKASAINKITQMTQLYCAYEQLYFSGSPIGFATEGIIENQDNNLWNIVVVVDTEFATAGDMNALQSYLNKGGTVIIDSVSLKTNEYGKPWNATLKEGKGKIINVETAKDATDKAIEFINASSDAPLIKIAEDNGMDSPTCVYRSIKGDSDDKVIINIANYGKNESEIKLSFSDETKVKSIKDVLTGKRYSTRKAIKLPVYGVLLLEVQKDKKD